MFTGHWRSLWMGKPLEASEYGETPSISGSSWQKISWNWENIILGIWGKCHVHSSCSYSSLHLQPLIGRGYWASSVFGLNGCHHLCAFMFSARRRRLHSRVFSPILGWAFLCESPHQEEQNLHHTHVLVQLYLRPCPSLPLPCRNDGSWYRARRRDKRGSAEQAAQKQGGSCSIELLKC